MTINDNIIGQLKNTLNILQINLTRTTSFLLNEKVKITGNENELILYEKIKNISNKMLNVYNHEQVKNILLNDAPFITIIKNSISVALKCFDQLMNIANEFNKIMTNNYDKMFKGKFFYEYGIDKITKNEYSSKILEIGENIGTVLLNIYVFIMDLYFLRRFLDKDYITNTIAYTGYLHTFNYLFILVKYFDFKITHSTSSEIEMSKLESIIKKKEYSEDIMALYMPKIFYQCIDMSSFPAKFE